MNDEAKQKTFSLVLKHWREYVEAVDKQHQHDDWWTDGEPEAHAYDFSLHLQYALWCEEEESNA